MLHSKDDIKSWLIGAVGLGAGLPAVMAVLGHPRWVYQGLGRSPNKWKASEEATFGFWLYTVSDLCLATLCGASFVTQDAVSQTVVLTATVVHQVGYLLAAIPSFGFQQQYCASIVAAAMAGLLALQP